MHGKIYHVHNKLLSFLMMGFFISRNIGKFVKNVTEYKTKLPYYLTIKVSVIKFIN